MAYSPPLRAPRTTTQYGSGAADRLVALLRHSAADGSEADPRRHAGQQQPTGRERALSVSLASESTSPLVYAGFLCAATGGLLFGHVVDDTCTLTV